MRGNTTEQRAFFVSIPHQVFDQVLPTLKDTELRVLLIVLRQTLGWHGNGPNGSKAADWLSHSQLRERTGRASEAVSSAVDVLVRRGLIEVADATGCAIPTSAQRRAHQGRLYYRPGRLIPLPGMAPVSDASDTSKSEIRKAKTTTSNNKLTSCRFRNAEPQTRVLSGLPVGDREASAAPPAEATQIEREKAKIRQQLARLPGGRAGGASSP